MARSSARDLQPIVDNPKILIPEARIVQKRMKPTKPTIDSYIQPHIIPLCNAIRLPTGSKI